MGYPSGRQEGKREREQKKKKVEAIKKKIKGVGGEESLPKKKK